MCLHVFEGQIERLRQPHDAGHVLRAAPQHPLLSATDDHAVDAQGGIDVQKTRPFGAMKFVRAAREEIDVELLEVHGVMPHGLNGVAVEVGAMLPTHRRDTRQIDHHPDFVVGVHERHQRFGL